MSSLKKLCIHVGDYDSCKLSYPVVCCHSLEDVKKAI